MTRPFSKMAFLLVFFLLIGKVSGFAQVQTRIVAGQISLGNAIKPDENSYSGFRDSLEKKLKVNPHDTTSLFYKALLLEQFNNQLAKPSPGDKIVYQNLIAAKNIITQLFDLKMQDFRLKVLRAQTYMDLTYQFANDESWKYNAKEIDDRRNLFNNYKKLSNEYHDELAKIDSINAYDYQKLKVNSNYPVR